MKHLIYGVHAVLEALKNSNRQHKTLYLTQDKIEEFSTFKHIIKIIDKKQFDHLVGEGITHQGIVLETSDLPAVHIEDIVSDSEDDLILILDQITDPRNMGALLRTAACFGVSAVVTTERNSPSADGVLAKTACGAVEHVPIIRVKNLARAIEYLKENGYWTVGMAERGKEYLHNATLTGKLALVLGAEGDGMRKLTMQNCDYLIKLPTTSFSTLNVSVAGAVAMYEIQKGRVSLC